jgi:hypothetical protein
MAEPLVHAIFPLCSKAFVPLVRRDPNRRSYQRTRRLAAAAIPSCRATMPRSLSG